MSHKERIENLEFHIEQLYTLIDVQGDLIEELKKQVIELEFNIQQIPSSSKSSYLNRIFKFIHGE